MSNLWFSPLTPAILLLLGALTIVIIFKLFDFELNRHDLIKQYTGLGVSGLVFGLLAIRIAGKISHRSIDPPLVLAPWGTGDGLTIRMDGMSLAFLFIPVLLLIALFWAYQKTDHAVLMGLAGAGALVFVAANGISFSYALLLFDIAGCVYWIHRQHPTLAMARVLLSVFTTLGLMLAALSPGTFIGGTALAFSLWLRLGVLPFVEISLWSREKIAGESAMFWLALSTAVGLYVAARFLTVPLPAVIYNLMGLTLLLNAGLAWLGNADGERIRIKLLQMVLLQPGLALLITPLPATISIALALEYTMALGALWIMPRVGKPDIFERHWLWVYATPVLATLSLIGFPFTFGWTVHQGLYGNLLQNNHTGVLAVVLLAEGIALSVLYEYWKTLLAGHDKREKNLLTALILTVPFLFPGLAGLVFNVVTGLDFAQAKPFPAQLSTVTLVANLAVIWMIAAGFGYGRNFILQYLNLNPQLVEPLLRLGWLWPHLQRVMAQLNHSILRFKATLEGAHYLSWALLLAITGILVVILK